MIRPVVDVDMGVGREYGYRDLARRVAVCAFDPAEVVSQAQMQTVRLAADATVIEVAAYLGVAISTVSKWETGETTAWLHVRARWRAACVEAPGRLAPCTDWRFNPRCPHCLTSTGARQRVRAVGWQRRGSRPQTRKDTTHGDQVDG